LGEEWFGWGKLRSRFMTDILDNDFESAPPSAERVAARAMVLSAVSCRGAIESDAGKAGAEALRQRILPWLEDIGAASELEPAEAALISTPLGKLDSRTCVDATWQSEGVQVLAWALHCAKLPPAHVQCDPADVANGMGFLDDRERTPMHNPVLRHEDEIGKWTDTYMTLHWRLRLITSNPGPMDFVANVAAATWYPLRLDRLELQDNDIIIDGVPIHKLDQARYRQILSIAQERHRAFNWLVGFELIYSQVTTDT
jgi:Domain of unknown function (DUF4272)